MIISLILLSICVAIGISLYIKPKIDEELKYVQQEVIHEHEQQKLIMIAKAIADSADKIVQGTIDVVKSEKVVGNYLGFEIPEYVEHSNDKYLYHGLSTFQATEPTVEDETYLVIPPGLLYKKA